MKVKKYFFILFIIFCLLSCTYSNQEKKFFNLVFKRDFKKLEKMLDKNPELINSTYYHNETALFVAERIYELELFSFLVKHGADIYVKDRNGKPIFELLIEKDKAEYLDVLLQNGFDLKYEDSEGNNILIIAADYNAVQCVKVILKYDIDINKGNKYNHTALIVTDKLEIVKNLLNNGADINVKSSPDGYNKLMYSIMNKQFEISEYLIKNGINIEEKDCIGETALFGAASRNYINIVNLLIEHGADIYVKDNSNQNLLFHAIHSNNIEFIEMLLKKGFKAHEKNIYGVDPFMLSIRFDYIDIVRLLIKYGANVNEKYDIEHIPTALQEAVDKQFYDIVKVLLENGAKTDNLERLEETTPEIHELINKYRK